MDQPLRSFDDLVKFLDGKQIPHRVDAENHVVQLAVGPPALPAPVFVRWESKIPYIQIMQQMSQPIPEPRLRDVEVACTRVNDAASLPGFGVNYATHVIYYRIAAPVYDGQLSPDMLDRSITAVLNNAAQLAPAFKAVIDGGDGASVLSHVKA